MSGVLGLILLLGSLEVETSTLDALCPPLDLVRQAIESRVGEIRGENQVVTYRVVRSAGTDSDMIEMVLTGEDGKVLFERNLPLGEMACADAATAIALILERYFEELSPHSSFVDSEDTKPVEALQSEVLPSDTPQAALSTESHVEDASSDEELTNKTSTKEEKARAKAEPENVALATIKRDSHDRRFAFHLQAGSTTDWGAHLGFGIEYAIDRSLSVSIDTVLPLWRQREKVEPHLYAQTYNPVLLATAHYQWHWGSWSWGGGPLGLLWLQMSHLDSTESVTDAGLRTRSLFGAGLEGTGRFSLSSTLQLESGVRVAPIFTQPVSGFIIEGPAESESDILPPPRLFADVFMGLRVLF